jgi:ATP-binding cassette subfamily F protein 3
LTLVALEKVRRAFGDRVILEGVSVRIGEGDRVGIVGRNGSGKTTLLRLLAGLEEPDEGRRTERSDARIGLLGQIPDVPPGASVLEVASAPLAGHREREARLRSLEEEIAEERDADRRSRLVARHDELQARFAALGGWDAPRRVEEALGAFGFRREHLGRAAGTLSGGEKARVALAGLLAAGFDLLLLDEPTNHLDLDGIEYLEGRLRDFPGAFVLVSHDRRLLDALARTVLFVESPRVERYRGNFARFEEARALRLLTRAREAERIGRFVAKEEEFIRRNIGSQRSREAVGRRRRLERLEVPQAPRPEARGPRVAFGAAPDVPRRAGEPILDLRGVAARVGERTLFEGLDLTLRRGERLGLVGRNGSGKTTLLRIALGGRAPDAGEVRFRGEGVPGTYDQELADLDLSNTVMEETKRGKPSALEGELRDHLARFLFRGEAVFSPLSTLSGGERSRVALARLTLEPTSLLLLDEPTNHLDVFAREGLEEGLARYPGGAIVVSHDRAFLDRAVDRILLLEAGRGRVYEGNYAAFEEKRAEERAREDGARERAPAPSRKDAPPEPLAAPVAGRVRNPYKFARLEERILAVEERLQAIDAEIARPEVYLDGGRMKGLAAERDALRGELEGLYREWENWS